MARFSEILGSRVGSTTGIHATYGVIVLRIIADNPDAGDYIPQEDGTRKYASSEVLAQQYAPRLSTHPNNPSLVATQYQEVGNPAQGHFLVRISYQPIGIVIPPEIEEGWLPRVRGATVSRTIYEEPRAFADPDAPEPAPVSGLGRLRRLRSQALPTHQPGAKARTIGTTIYQPIKSSLATHYATTLLADGREQRQPLIATTSVEPAPQTVEWPALQLSLTRVQPNFSLARLPDLAWYMKAVNARQWWGAQPRHVLLTDLTIDPVERTMAGQRIEGRAWQATIVFLWSSVEWAPLNLVPLWYNEANEKHIVYRIDTEEKEVESFRIKGHVNFDNAFTDLER